MTRLRRNLAVKTAGTLMVTTLAAFVGVAVSASQTPDHHAQMTARGAKAMGFDQTATTHHFYLYEEGGAIQVTINDAKDKQNLTAIRSHLPHIAKMFAAGDFSSPMFIHEESVPGAETMARLRDSISYAYEDVPNGGRVRITTRQPRALSAIHEFMRYQITDHKTGDSSAIAREKPLASYGETSPKRLRRGGGLNPSRVP